MDNSRIRELQAALSEKVAANKELANSVKIEDGTLILEAEHKTEFDKNMAAIREIKGMIESQKELGEVEAWSAGVDTDSVAVAAGATAAVSPDLILEAKTLGQMFLESDEFKALQNGRAGLNMNSPFEYKGVFNGGYNVKDVYSTGLTGSIAHFGRVQRDLTMDAPKRKTRVRDLFPARSTTAAVIEYFRVIGYTEGSTPATYTTVNSASVVPERSGDPEVFGLKPHTALKFVGEQAPVRTIAHWEAAHRNVLADEPQLRGIIDNELLYGLRLQEDFQILSGSGTGEDLKGILNTAGVQQYAWSSGASSPVDDTMGDAIRRAATLAFLAYYEPTGVVVHPSDWEKIELTKDLNGQYLMAVSMQLGGEARLWRMPVIDTPAIAEGTGLVGAFGTGAQLYDREGSNIRISENHEDFFVRNAIVILAEQRLALAVKRPESFVEVTFDAAP